MRALFHRFTVVYVETALTTPFPLTAAAVRVIIPAVLRVMRCPIFGHR